MEIDWSNQIKPVIVTKYSIPDNSDIYDLWVNEQFVIVQLVANLTDSVGATKQYQSTYVMSRGSRTYLNAYISIPHHDKASFVDLNRETGEILTIDTEGLTLYHLASSMLSVNPTNNDLLNQEFTFLVRGESSNEYDPSHTLICSFTFKYIVVQVDSLAMWPTGLTLPTDYYANYPGQLFIPISRYVFGSNITYGVVSDQEKDVPIHFFLQQNDTVISWWEMNSTNFTYTFIRTEQFDSLDDTEINIYTQDA